jgi:hypothetical protein
MPLAPGATAGLPAVSYDCFQLVGEFKNMAGDLGNKLPLQRTAETGD